MKKFLFILGVIIASSATVSAQQILEVSFDLNYPTSEKPAPLKVKEGNALPLSSKPLPTRDGYRFGGWYSTPECLPEQEWRFGNNSSFYTPATDSMKVEKNMILYAKWASPKAISSVEDLDGIRDDLNGWYVLQNDIDLSGIENWIPIGEYEGNYEFAPGEWWRHAFKGIFDGNGHTIKGLNITSLTTDKSGLFGTVANGEILNLNMTESRLVFTAERPYVAPLAGILKQDDNQVCAVRNCSVTGTLIKVTTTNTAGTFHSFTGLCGGAWGGTLEGNYVSGTMDIDMAGTGGGELYVGSYLGEAYNDTRNCTSDFDIKVHFSSPQPAGSFKAFIGGLQSSATNVENCTAKGSIVVSGEAGVEDIFIGGLVGSERYGAVRNSISYVEMSVKDMTTAHIGGIIGEFNSGYGVIGAAFGTTTTSVNDCTFDGTLSLENVGSPRTGAVSGAGVPEALSSPWGLSMGYKVENCTSNIK